MVSPMRPYRLRSDLRRERAGQFGYPLGVVPPDAEEPHQGWTKTLDDGPDAGGTTASYHVLVSSDRLKPLIDAAFGLLPTRVAAIVELGSCDAYRRVDVFMSAEPISLEAFRDIWEHYEPFLLEDATMAIGANAESPVIEVFLEQDKVLHLHVPDGMTSEVERMFKRFDLNEVECHWDRQLPENDVLEIRPVLASGEGFTESIDDLLLDLKLAWDLVLNIDPDRNVDDGGRELGLTLWHALVVIESRDPPLERTASASIWATARSLSEMQAIVEDALAVYADWSIVADYAVDRVAYDERPDDLATLPPRRRRAAVHIVDMQTSDLAP